MLILRIHMVPNSTIMDRNATSDRPYDMPVSRIGRPESIVLIVRACNITPETAPGNPEGAATRW
jgi:hypothetical protein